MVGERNGKLKEVKTDRRNSRCECSTLVDLGIIEQQPARTHINVSSTYLKAQTLPTSLLWKFPFM